MAVTWTFCIFESGRYLIDTIVGTRMLLFNIILYHYYYFYYYYTVVVRACLIPDVTVTTSLSLLFKIYIYKKKVITIPTSKLVLTLSFACVDIPEVPDVLCNRNTKCSTVRKVYTGIPEKSSKRSIYVLYNIK